ncbi:putative phosphatidate phosphatase isoform X3 [Drosophila serrata]|uniref:putative phosphatidate phosphatase isoform X3 n=1 Tax=Drosophila serrata TaxID=7274 RepID=UPI000A1D0166|nr:putative phosphatidate phosphatase isoform X3 [Drosophila serrata]
MSNESSVSETTPLRRPETQAIENVAQTVVNSSNNNNNNYGDTVAVRLQGGDSSHQQQEQQQQQQQQPATDMDTNKRILCRVGLDILILLCVGFPILIFYLLGDPYKRGFFCDDESLKHPFHDSTVRNWMLYFIGVVIPVGVVCQPVMPDGSTCDDPVNAGKYIQEFTCKGVGSSDRMLKEMRLSFPSGHSSFTFFAMVYLALYLQARMTWKGSKLLRHMLQFVFIMVAWYTALSRVSDYKHHWSDVLAGSLIGSTCALVVVNFVSDLFQKPSIKSYLPRTAQDMNATQGPPMQNQGIRVTTN